jgi:hypothetical protein
MEGTIAAIGPDEKTIIAIPSIRGLGIATIRITAGEVGNTSRYLALGPFLFNM